MVTVKCQRITAVLLLLLGLVFVLVAVIAKSPLNTYMDNMIKQAVLLTPGTTTFDNWSVPPVPIYDDMYLFNITNPDEFNAGAKADLELIGPFVYRKLELKGSPNVTGDLKYAMYFDDETYYYDDKETVLRNNKTRLTDIIYIPNLPLITVVAQLAHNKVLPEAFKKILEELVEVYDSKDNITSVVLRGTIEGVLWGMDDPIMKVLNSLKLAPSPQLALQVNGSTDPFALTKPTVVYTGHSDISRIAEYMLFHGKNSSGCWGSVAANVINGTEGSMFEPLRANNKSKPVSIYNEQLNRNVDMYFVNESSFKGVTCYVYNIPDWALQNVTGNPTNIAYYAYTYSGMLNLTKCAQNVPLYITKAMFLDADERLLENVTMPEVANKSIHDTYLCVEPYTGVTIDAHKRIQISVQIEHHDIIGVLNKTQPAFVPLVFIDEHASITDDLTATLKKDLLIPILISHIAFYVLCSLGTVLILTSITLHVTLIINKYKPNDDDEDRLLPINEESDPVTTDNSDQYLSFDGKSSRYYDPISS